MRITTTFFAMALAIAICLPAAATQNQIEKSRYSWEGKDVNDQNPLGPGHLPGDYTEAQQKPKPKPQTPASGTVSPGTATQTPSVPKPAKPPKPPVVISPKPTKPNSSGNSGSNVGSTQNGTVTLPNGTTVYKNITTKTHKDLK